MSHKKDKMDKIKVKSDKILKVEPTSKGVKAMVDHYLSKSIDYKTSKETAEKVVENVVTYKKENSVKELRNAFEVLMKNGGDTHQKTPGKRLKRLGFSSARKKK